MAAELPYWPRMLKRAKAAAYCDLTRPAFEAEVMAGRLPLPVKLGGEDHWDRDALDDDLSRISGRIADWRKDCPGLAA
jgi:hypothetical protein